MAAEMVEVSEVEKGSSIASEEILGEEEEDSCFQDIVLLLEHGVTAEEIKRLQEIGINTIKGIQMTTRKRLLEIKGYNEYIINKIKDACSKLSFSTGFITALEVADQRKQLFKISTGSKNLDALLDGGIESMSITEVFGEFGTGKTQLSHTLCVTAQIPNGDGYTGGKVVFIDTENTFRPVRLQEIANRFNLDPTSVLQNILYARAYNSEHQFELLRDVAAKFHEEAGVFKLLIIDSIMALFRVDFTGRGEISHRQQKLGQMMSRLQKISEEYNITVFLTNQITSDLTQLNQIDASKPIGGNILAHATTTRLSLSKGVNGIRIAKIYGSPELEENETVYAITSGGITDVKN